MEEFRPTAKYVPCQMVVSAKAKREQDPDTGGGGGRVWDSDAPAESICILQEECSRQGNSQRRGPGVDRCLMILRNIHRPEWLEQRE